MQPEGVQEKNRARLAYCLTQWKRPHGGSIPQTEEGIAEHERLVADYEVIYGPPNPNSLKQYASVYAGIRLGLEAQAESDEELKRFMEAEKAREEKAQADSEKREREMLADAQRREADRVLSLSARSLPILRMQVERLSGYVAKDFARSNQLLDMLNSDRFKDSPLRGEIRGNLRDVEKRLAEYRKRLAKFEEDVREAEAEQDWARGVLGLEAPATVSEGEEDTPTTKVHEYSVQFVQKSNGFYHPAERHDRAVLANAGFGRLQGDPLVIAPDGRVKAWPVEGPHRVTINGADIQFTPNGNHLLAQLSDEDLKVLLNERET